MLQKLQILYYVNVFWFNIKLLKRVTDDFFYAKKVFLFLPFLNLGTQIRCPQNRYTDLKSALDQPLKVFKNNQVKFLKAVFHKFHLVNSRILRSI